MLHRLNIPSSSGNLRENRVHGAFVAVEVSAAVVQAGVNPSCKGKHIIQR